MGLFGVALYVSLLLTNAIAILNEERFLAKIGWLSPSQAPRDAAFQYDANGYGAAQGDVSMKARLVHLISAVRTLMRIPLIIVNIVIIFYEFALG